MILYHKDKDGNHVPIPPAVVPVDQTLTKANRAADAKVTGDEIASVKKHIGLQFPVVKVEDYLYEHDCISMDYGYAAAYFKKNPEVSVGGCSSMRSGAIYGRNFDWMYDNGVSFVVRTPAKDSTHGVVGISGHLSALTKEFVESRLYNEAYRILPFYLTDGINDAGLVCNINVVPVAYGKTTGTTPTEVQTDEVCAIMLPRFVLDRFSNAADAVSYLQKHVSIYVPDSLHQMGYEIHAMIADESDTYAVEFINNATVVTKIDGHPYMTNFHLHGVTFNQDGSVYTPGTQDATHNAMITNGVEGFGSGLERYNIINSQINTANSQAGMRALLDKLMYTRAYSRSENPFWYTEFVGGTNNVASAPSAFTAVVNEYIGYYESRQRGDGKTWQTVHSAVYDLQNKSLVLRVQEENVDHEYGFSYVTHDEFENALANKTQKIQIDYINGEFKIGDRVINYKELYESLKVGPNFVFILHGDRAYLCSYIQDDPEYMRELRFESVINSSGMTKTSSIYVISNDGVDIANVTVTDINSENVGNKVTEITELNKNSVTHYPSMKVFDDVTGKLKEDMSEKQDTISDLSTIRAGAAAGATALQSVPDTYALKTDLPKVWYGTQAEYDSITIKDPDTDYNIYEE